MVMLLSRYLHCRHQIPWQHVITVDDRERLRVVSAFVSIRACITNLSYLSPTVFVDIIF